MDMIIFGAQGYALGTYKAIKVLYPERRVLFFAVTSMSNNPPTLGGLDVKEIVTVSGDYSRKEKKNIEILIATPENVQGEIEKTLDGYGFINHTRLTSQLWDELMTRKNMITGEFRPLTDSADNNNNPSDAKGPVVSIYMAKSHVDKPLNNPFTLPDHMIPIQVGATNTGDVIADIMDDSGDNISRKNGNYCELTGLYWVWKNVLRDDSRGSGPDGYFGFAQYRRILMLSDDDMARLEADDVDVVLPYPLMYEPDINAHHERYIKAGDWNALTAALGELHPEYAEAFPQVLSQQYMYNYNVILAKKSVLMDYCEWLFPILERAEDLSDPKGRDRSDRYIGYMGETLETLYFMKNRDRFNIAHTACRLLV